LKKILFVLLAILGLLLSSVFLYFQLGDCGIAPWSCGDYTTKKEWTTQKLTVGSGPEDMAIDTSMGLTRIIVSCAERRATQPEIGQFHQINPADNSVALMNIVPKDLAILPHGIDVVTIDSVPFLYAISHDVEESTTKHRIYRFKINQNVLLLDKNFTLEDELLTGPNDIDVLEDGSFYVSNPMPSNGPNESTKAILGVKNGSIVHFDGKDKWQIAAKDFCFPNGIWVDESKDLLYVANGACHEVARYEIQGGNINTASKQSTLQHDQKITLGDNMLIDNQGRLWVTSHPCPLDIMAHTENEAEKAPIQIYTIDPTSLTTNTAFQNNGELISAASTALYIDNRLYLSQVFDPFVLVVEGLSGL